MALRGTLRLKLTLWTLAVFAVIQVGVVVAVALLRGDSLRETADAELREVTGAAIDQIVDLRPAWEAPAIAALLPHDTGFLVFAVRERDGRVRVTNARDAEAWPFTDFEAIPVGPLRPVVGDVPAERVEPLTGRPGALRMITVPFRTRDEGLLYFQAAVRSGLLDRSLGSLLGIFGVGIPAGLIAAAVAAWLIAGRAVAPMRELSEAARAVSPDRPGEGLRVDSSDGEVQRLQGELNGALARLERGLRAQERFVADVSHELKTPIAVLLAEAQARRGRAGDAADRRFAESVEEEMRRLAQLVESFLGLTRWEMVGRPDRWVEVAANDLVLESVQRADALARQHGVRLSTQLVDGEDDEATTVRGDPELLESMLGNLIRNAIHHSPRGAVVEVRATRGDGRIELAVRDAGPGLPPEMRDELFERFVRGGEGGQGLGLAIAAGIARLHGGGVRAEDVAGGPGARFTAWLPVPPASRPA